MRGYNKWNFRPYVPYDRDGKKPYICRLEPHGDYIIGEWFDIDDNGPYKLYYRERGTEDEKSMFLLGDIFKIDNLKPNCEYELYIKGKKKSNIRIVKTGFAPGKVVSYLHHEDPQYDFSGHCLCSPSLLKLPNGSLLASNDYYKNKAPQNLTTIYRSDDNGLSWYYVTDLFPCFWGKLFYHKGNVYMLATSTEYGDLLIGKSEDEGRTWTTPTVILRGSNSVFESGLHKAPLNVVNAYGRLWASVEYGSWVRGSYSNSLFSIDENDDLLAAESWSCTGFLKHDPNWENAENVVGAIEGNVICTPDGYLINMLRYSNNKALMLKIDPNKPESLPEFYKIANFPMGHSKFEIVQYENRYYAIGNRLPKRNILSLYVSDDLENWDFVKDLINYENMDSNVIGFQYPSAFIEDKKLYVLVRTAFNGAFNYHDANYLTFHKFDI